MLEIWVQCCHLRRPAGQHGTMSSPLDMNTRTRPQLARLLWTCESRRRNHPTRCSPAHVKSKVLVVQLAWKVGVPRRPRAVMLSCLCRPRQPHAATTPQQNPNHHVSPLLMRFALCGHADRELPPVARSTASVAAGTT